MMTVQMLVLVRVRLGVGIRIAMCVLIRRWCMREVSIGIRMRRPWCLCRF